MNIMVVPREIDHSGKKYEDSQLIKSIYSQLMSMNVQKIWFGLPPGLTHWDGASPFTDKIIISMARSPDIVAMQQAFEIADAKAYNSAASILTAQNKLGTFMILSRFNIPIPPTHLWIADNNGYFKRESVSPAIKVLYGNGCELEDIEAAKAYCVSRKLSHSIIQENLSPSKEYKVYMIGSSTSFVCPISEFGGIRSIQQPSSKEEFELEAAVNFENCSETRRIAHLAKKAVKHIGLKLASVDILVTEFGEFVIDINDFPSYGPIEGISALICQKILADEI